MVCRDQEKCEKARQEIIEDTQNSDVHCEQCDLSSFDSIRKFVT
uniref:Uncharacterized protein n=1 Tax=Megaselia scalaris TaxID=36166 RepID=T1GZG0_MEGSC